MYLLSGGFSYVFLVKDNTKNKNYALKRMLVNCQTDLDNCKQEITIMVCTIECYNKLI